MPGPDDRDWDFPEPQSAADPTSVELPEPEPEPIYDTGSDAWWRQQAAAQRAAAERDPSPPVFPPPATPLMPPLELVEPEVLNLPTGPSPFEEAYLPAEEVWPAVAAEPEPAPRPVLRPLVPEDVYDDAPADPAAFPPGWFRAEEDPEITPVHHTPLPAMPVEPVYEAPAYDAPAAELPVAPPVEPAYEAPAVEPVVQPVVEPVVQSVVEPVAEVPPLRPAYARTEPAYEPPANQPPAPVAEPGPVYESRTTFLDEGPAEPEFTPDVLPGGGDGGRVGVGKALAWAGLAIAGVGLLVIAFLLLGKDEPKGTPTVASPVTTAPAVVDPTAEPTAEPTAGPTAEPSTAPAAEAAPIVPLTVLNNSRITGLADRSAAKFRAGGWPVPTTGNYRGQIDTTTIYYPEGQKASAERFGKQFGVRVLPRFASLPGSGMTVVVTRDFA